MNNHKLNINKIRQQQISETRNLLPETEVSVDAQHLRNISISLNTKLQTVSNPQLGSYDADLLDFFQNCRTEISLSEIKRQGFRTSTGKLSQPKNPPESVSKLRKKGWIIQLDERDDDNYYVYLGPSTNYSLEEVRAFIKHHKNPWVYPQLKSKV